MDVEAILAAVRVVVREELGATVRRAVTFQRAAEMMDCSTKHVSRMVKSGRLLVVDIEGARRIPVSEIDRLTSAPAPLKSSGATPERTRYDASKALAKLEALRRRR